MKLKLITTLLAGLAAAALPLQAALALGPVEQQPGTYQFGGLAVKSYMCVEPGISVEESPSRAAWWSGRFGAYAKSPGGAWPALPPLPAGYARVSEYWNADFVDACPNAQAPNDNPDIANGAPYTLTFNYTLPVGVTNPARLSVWEGVSYGIPSKMEWIPAGGATSADGTISVTTGFDYQGSPGWVDREVNPGVGPVYVVLAWTGPTYSDMGGYTWARPAADAATAAGVLQGVGGDQFDPSVPLTRAEAATALLKLAGFPPGVAQIEYLDAQGGYVSEMNVADAPPAAWYTPYVSAAVAYGVMSGVGTTGWPTQQTVFDPNGIMTRAEAATALMHVYALDNFAGPSEPSGAPRIFTDQSAIPAWAVSSVEKATELGVIAGTPTGGFDPNAPVTRAEFAVMVAKTLALPGVGLR